jgi:hypothetical protein
VVIKGLTRQRALGMVARPVVLLKGPTASWWAMKPRAVALQAGAVGVDEPSLSLSCGMPGNGFWQGIVDETRRWIKIKSLWDAATCAQTTPRDGNDHIRSNHR